MLNKCILNPNYKRIIKVQNTFQKMLSISPSPLAFLTFYFLANESILLKIGYKLDVILLKFVFWICHIARDLRYPKKQKLIKLITVVKV